MYGEVPNPLMREAQGEPREGPARAHSPAFRGQISDLEAHPSRLSPHTSDFRPHIHNSQITPLMCDRKLPCRALDPRPQASHLEASSQTFHLIPHTSDHLPNAHLTTLALASHLINLAPLPLSLTECLCIFYCCQCFAQLLVPQCQALSPP